MNKDNKLKNENKTLKKKIKELEQENKILKEKVKILTYKLTNSGEIYEKLSFVKVPYGFTITTKEIKGENYVYAQKRIDGKVKSVYIGRSDLASEELVEAKIEKWLSNNYPSLLENEID